MQQKEDIMIKLDKNQVRINNKAEVEEAVALMMEWILKKSLTCFLGVVYLKMEEQEDKTIGINNRNIKEEETQIEVIINNKVMKTQ